MSESESRKIDKLSMQGIVWLTWSAAWHYHWPHSAACKLGVWPCRLFSLHSEQACSAEHFMFI